LNNAVVRHTYVHQQSAKTANVFSASIGSGPQGGLTPNDIATAYNAKPNLTASKYPQTLAVLELADYYPDDISYYQNYFNLGNMPVNRVLVDGGVTRSRHGSYGQRSETTLDIQLQMALAPADSTILVYEGPNTDNGFLDILNQIATDNTAKQISCSWGSDEGSNNSSYLQSENQIFQQMAAQGQSFFSSAGDSGAYDNGNQLSVDDPAAQPYVTGVGGTQLSLLSNGSYGLETTWNGGSISAGAGGGGISKIWPIPAYQKGIAGAASTSKRNVPDVALNADPDTGYAIFYRGFWSVYGGTSCATPLWAAYAAQINQERLTNGYAAIGFLNPRLYALANSSHYALAFHDISDGSNNLKYVAKPGYDNATGWGSFNGANLLANLAIDQPVIAPSVTVIAPNGGESIPIGTKLLIHWTSSNMAAKKHLSFYFSKNAGKTWSLIRSNLTLIGSLQWKVTKAQRTTQGLIKVCLPKSGKVAAVCDSSDGVFSVNYPPRVGLLNDCQLSRDT
jgi:kumamolisin